MKNKAITQAILDAGVTHVDNPSGPRIDKVRKIFSNMKQGSIVLDIGCSNGTILEPCAGRHMIFGVDICPDLASAARKRGIQAQQHDFESGPLPFRSGSFDAVFFGEAIEHQLDTDYILSEINRVLKPGGELVMTFPNIRTLLGLAMMAFLDLPPMYAARYRSPHFRDFTLTTVEMALKNHGFEIFQSLGSSFFVPKIGECLPWIASFFPSWSHTVIVMADKIADSIYKPKETIGAIY